MTIAILTRFRVGVTIRAVAVPGSGVWGGVGSGRLEGIHGAMEYEVQIHDVWIPVPRKLAERMFEGWQFTDKNGEMIDGIELLDSLGPGEVHTLAAGHIPFRRRA